MEQSTAGRAGPLRVLHVAQPAEGGVARVVADLVRAQLAAGLDVRAACPEQGGLAPSLRGLGSEVRAWEAGRDPGLAVASEARRLARLVGEVRPDVVHAHSAKAGLAARLAVRGRLPTVFQPHAWSFEAVTGTTAALARRWEQYAARWSARVVCVSEAERRTGLRAGVRAAWSVIPNGVDTDLFSPGPAALPAPGPRESGGRPGGSRPVDAPGPLVVCVGRLCRQKGQDVLLDAWPQMLRRLPGARLVLVGEGPAEERLRQAAAATGAGASVSFPGAVADPAPWYRAADLVVLPSRWEGMALAPMEAMACARAVVVTDVGGSRESLPPGHVPYCLVPPEDPGALARAAVGVLTDARLRDALALAGRRHVLSSHDVRRTAEQFADLYRELLGMQRTDPRENRTP
ncbi:glycosyltransferase family 4 protein [Streptomyces physcomitrii]|uniref:Glycosyltransferase family 4 protein n=1 Tax=Streptomyces physcomitrii TaxID=2724184 RepID=A0ABX1H3R0_9ACTN|nr:glycosyltransferase family 4 protein [Streptomyces physcomitrii]NKI41671.1 glycosyltransferase family 4 protein [Streptomyces physcomitrii]